MSEFRPASPSRPLPEEPGSVKNIVSMLQQSSKSSKSLPLETVATLSKVKEQAKRALTGKAAPINGGKTRRVKKNRKTRKHKKLNKKGTRKHR